jgi:hypothetical protein
LLSTENVCVPCVSREYFQRFVQAGTLGFQQVRYLKAFPGTSMCEVESDFAPPDPMRLWVFDRWPRINKDETYRVLNTHVSYVSDMHSKLTKIFIHSDVRDLCVQAVLLYALQILKLESSFVKCRRFCSPIWP